MIKPTHPVVRYLNNAFLTILILLVCNALAYDLIMIDSTWTPYLYDDPINIHPLMKWLLDSDSLMVNFDRINVDISIVNVCVIGKYKTLTLVECYYKIYGNSITIIYYDSRYCFSKCARFSINFDKI